MSVGEWEESVGIVRYDVKNATEDTGSPGLHI